MLHYLIVFIFAIGACGKLMITPACCDLGTRHSHLAAAFKTKIASTSAVCLLTGFTFVIVARQLIAISLVFYVPPISTESNDRTILIASGVKFSAWSPFREVFPSPHLHGSNKSPVSVDKYSLVTSTLASVMTLLCGALMT
jgi:hypothetical protein